MLLDQLFERRLLVLSGKGGVGKSSVGAALALAASRRGKRVLLVEVAAPVDACRRFAGFASGGQQHEILPGFSAINLDPAEVLAAYVRHVVHLELIARKILTSPVYHRFLAAAPGLKELMVLGQVMVLEEAHRGRQPLWDLIVLDAPASGHGLAFLKVPLAASAAIPAGPVGANARRIIALLRDPRRTALLVVAIPEELAVVEALEFGRQAREELGLEPAAFVLNGCHERRFSDEEEAELLRLAAAGADGLVERGVPLPAGLRAARRQIRRRKLTRFYESRLRRAVDLPLVSLPFLFHDSLGLEQLRQLAERLEAA